MLKFNRTESAQRIIDECIFRVFHNQKNWECDSFTTFQQEDTVNRYMNHGIFNQFQNKVLTTRFQKKVWTNLEKNNLGYGDAMSALRELFYDYQEGIKFSTKYFMAL
jgi:hypothetical protein